MPVAVPGLEDAVQLSAGAYHVCALRSSGQVVCWGANTNGELGDGTTTDRAGATTDVVGITDAAEIGSGMYHSCARLASGPLLCWGRNDFGQTGDGTPVSPRPTPVEVIGLP
jgi:alpha-tubulin suppressor-like RCC1 family protein